MWKQQRCICDLIAQRSRVAVMDGTSQTNTSGQTNARDVNQILWRGSYNVAFATWTLQRPFVAVIDVTPLTCTSGQTNACDVKSLRLICARNGCRVMLIFFYLLAMAELSPYGLHSVYPLYLHTMNDARWYKLIPRVKTIHINATCQTISCKLIWFQGN